MSIKTPHPYRCEEGNFYRNGHHHRFDSWDNFLAEWGDLDRDLNFVWRWDWHTPDPDDYPQGYPLPPQTVTLFYMLQRKAICLSVEVDVTDEDEARVREFLVPYWDLMKQMWEPIS